MTSFSLTCIRFFRAFTRGFREPEFRRLVFIVGTLLISGSIVYHFVEGWEYIDSLYFSVTTLTTVGNPFLAPVTVGGKIFTMVYLLIGIGVMLSFVARVAEQAKKEASVAKGLANDSYRHTKKILTSFDAAFDEPKDEE